MEYSESYVDEDTYSREASEPAGVVNASNREVVMVWTTFLAFIMATRVSIIPKEEIFAGRPLRELGRGATMLVQEYAWRRKHDSPTAPLSVAVKSLQYGLPEDATDLRARPKDESLRLGDFTLELRALTHGSLRSHKNIVQVFGITWAEKGLPAIIVEKASDRYPTLDQLLLSKRKLTGVEKAELLAGIAEGLGTIHSIQLTHGDLKPANILIFEEQSGAALIPKLSDFAFSRSWKETLGSGGTEYWNAPECGPLRSQPNPDQRVALRDYFSLGMICWNVFREEAPFCSLGAETDSSTSARTMIQEAKESGYLLHRLAKLKQENNHEAFLFRSNKISAECDDENAILNIVEVIERLLQPIPGQRLYRAQFLGASSTLRPDEARNFDTGILEVPGKLRFRWRCVEEEIIIQTKEDGSYQMLDNEEVLQSLNRDKNDLLIRAAERARKETGIRFNLSEGNQPSGSSRQGTMTEVKGPPEIASIMAERHEDTLNSNTATDQDKANAAFHQAASVRRHDPQAARLLCRRAGLLGHELARANYLLWSINEGHEIDLDASVHAEWLSESLTGPQIVSQLQGHHPSGFPEVLRQALADRIKYPDSASLVLALTEIFVIDVLGNQHSPHDKFYTNGKWGTLETAKEPTFERFRQGIPELRDDIPSDALHTVAIYGTGQVIRDLVRNHHVEIDAQCQTEYFTHPLSALEMAFLRHNSDTMRALVDLGADVLPLFKEHSLKAFWREGEMGNVKWLHHLLPLMGGENRRQAEKQLYTFLLSNQGLQGTIMYSNWSVFVGILDLIRPLGPEHQVKLALSLAISLRRFEFVVALLACCEGDQRQLTHSAEVLAAVLSKPRVAPVPPPTFTRANVNVQKRFQASFRRPSDTFYQGIMLAILSK